MDEFKELDVLENTDDTVKERLAEEFPPQDTDEKERVFRMSERKYNIKKNESAEFISGDETVKGVEVYKRPKWKVFASLAACAVIVAGIGGGGYMLKHMKGRTPQTVISEINDKTTAPFGDFAASEYYIPDYNSEQKTFHFNKYDHDVPYYGGEVIPLEKRQKIADFFNSQEWKEAAPNEANEGGRKIKMTDEEIAENYITFQYVADNEIRMIEISSENVLTYNYFEIEEENGEKVCDNSYVQEYEIDWELFRSTIDAILNDTAEEAAVENVAPFGDFSLLEYYIPENIPEKGENVYLNENEDDAALILMPGKTVEQEKRDKLAEFFNSYDWTENTISAEILNEIITPSMILSGYSPDEETITFNYRDDKEIRMIEIKRTADIDILLYFHFDYITTENGKLIKVNYGETEETSLPFEVYMIDYELFRNTINDILRDEEVAEPQDNADKEAILQTFEKYDTFHFNSQSFLNYLNTKEYKLIFPDSPDVASTFFYGDQLPDDKRKAMLDVIKNADWTTEEIPDDDRLEYEQNGLATSHDFTTLFSFVDITGNDIIFMDIYKNIIEMSIYGCEYDESNSAYTFEKEYGKYYIRTTSPTFMTEINNIIYDDAE